VQIATKDSSIKCGDNSVRLLTLIMIAEKLGRKPSEILAVLEDRLELYESLSASAYRNTGVLKIGRYTIRKKKKKIWR